MTCGGTLTWREMEVLALLAKGHSNQWIAKKLGVSVFTVNNHLQSIYNKIGVNNRVAAAAWWWMRAAKNS